MVVVLLALGGEDGGPVVRRESGFAPCDRSGYATSPLKGRLYIPGRASASVPVVGAPVGRVPMPTAGIPYNMRGRETIDRESIVH